MIEAGVDALLLETHRLDQALIALGQLTPTTSLPIVVSLFAWPDSPAESVHQLEDLGFGRRPELRGRHACGPAHGRGVASGHPTPLIVKPMPAGIPGSNPGRVLPSVRRGVDRLARGSPPIMVGGCCGTNESHVAALRAAWYHG